MTTGRETVAGVDQSVSAIHAHSCQPKLGRRFLVIEKLFVTGQCSELRIWMSFCKQTCQSVDSVVSLVLRFGVTEGS